MDLHIHGPEPTAAERAAVDAVLGVATSAWAGGERNIEKEGRISLLPGRATRVRRDLLLPALHAVQSRFGWLPQGALNYICRRLDVPPAEAYGVATFYHLFALSPRPPAVAYVCDDIACRIRGGNGLCTELEKTLGPKRRDAWKRSPCLGQCERAPAALVFHAGEVPRAITLAPASTADIAGALDSASRESCDDLDTLRRSVPQAGSSDLRLIGRIGQIDPHSLHAYRSSGGYAALGRAVELGPEGIIREVTAAKLMGRGGAAFPTGRKWEVVAKAAAKPHYLVCNADESEPGTFKDRLLMEGDPFAVLEGMTIAGYATGCERGYMYLRGEYPQIWELYQDLKAYRAQPEPANKALLEARFEALVEQQTDFTASIGGVLKEMREHQAELLRVLERPEVPLHNNGRESDIRGYVKVRKISGGTRSDAGRRCRDTFASLRKTCRKLGISFWAYLRDRLRGLGQVPRLADLIRAKARELAEGKGQAATPTAIGGGAAE